MLLSYFLTRYRYSAYNITKIFSLTIITLPISISVDGQHSKNTLSLSSEMQAATVLDGGKT